MADVVELIKTPKIEFFLTSSVSERDIKQMANIHVEALQDDPTASLKFANKEEFRTMVENMLNVQIRVRDDPENSRTPVIPTPRSSCVNEWFIVKATVNSPNDDEQPNRIIGWASWLHEQLDLSKAPATQPPIEQDKLKDKRRLLTFDKGLGAFVRQQQNRIYAEWFQRRLDGSHGSLAPDFLSLRSCFILPEFQRHGVGRALVRYGCEHADRLQLDTLVTSTPMAKPLYEVAGGFEAFDYLEFNLIDWDLENRGKVQIERFQAANGNYRFWFMARMYRGSI